MNSIIRILMVTIPLVATCKQNPSSTYNSNHDLLQSNPPCPEQLTVFGDTLFQGEVYRGSFTPDGKAIYFFKKVNPVGENYRIYYSQMKDGSWSIPEKVTLGDEYSDLYPSISKDGKRMAFSSYRPIPEKFRNENEGPANAHLWYSDMTKNGWGEPIFMEFANSIGSYHSWVEFGWNDNIYFRQISPDWSTRQTLFTEWDGGKYTTPKVFQELEQWANWSSDVQIAGGSPGPNENIIFLDVATLDTITMKRGSDIWVSIKNGNKWNDPIPLSNDVNGSGFDVFPFFSPDRNCLFFIRDFDKIYQIQLENVLPLNE